MSDRVWLYIDVLSMIDCQCTTAAAAAAPPVNTRSSHDNAWLTYADNQAPTSVLLKSHSRVVRGEAVSLHHTAPTSSSSHPSTIFLHGAPCVLDVLTVAYLFSRHFSQILNCYQIVSYADVTNIIYRICSQQLRSVCDILQMSCAMLIMLVGTV